MNEEHIEELISLIKKKNPKKVFLQLPEGLLSLATKIVDQLDKEKIAAVICAEPCYGACDLRDKEARQLGCDLLVNIGHNKFYNNFPTAIDVLYYEWFIPLNIKKIKDIINKEIGKIKEKNIGLATTIQHLPYLKNVATILEEKGKKVNIIGQLLGCWPDLSEESSESVLFVGSGSFHPLGSSKHVYLLDLERGEIKDLSDEQYLKEKKRLARIEKARDAKLFGILVSTKPGQTDIQSAEKIKKLLEDKNKKAFIVSADTITNEKLIGLKADAFINTACPRIIENKFEKPVINKEDVNKLIE
ncbi:MAG: diphthamide biosynthesis enzyme Dph2 [Candidatus Aenigmarchaeota archaeon]|nr:diphthamide biosynthesis enzyme Dph2 [Candidatus Aenigmarchaeota archaeon]